MKGKDKMKAIMKQEIRNYLKKPIYWLGLLFVIVSLYRILSPFLSLQYFEPNHKFDKLSGESLSDADIMDGMIKASEEERRQAGLEYLQENYTAFFDSKQKAAAFLDKTRTLDMSEQEILADLEKTVGVVDRYAFEQFEFIQGTAEQVNAYIKDKLEEKNYTYYFSRRFADFAGLYLIFFAVFMLAFLFFRDTRKDTYELLHTKPISNWAYIGGMAGAGFFIILLPLFIVTILFGGLSMAHGVSQGFPVSAIDLLVASCCYVVPNILMVVGVYTGIAILFKNPLPAIPLLFIYIIYSNMGGYDQDGFYTYLGRPLAIMVRFPGQFFDVISHQYIVLNQIVLILATFALLFLAAFLWERRRNY
jgi:ABC-2 type transport system permease protein